MALVKANINYDDILKEVKGVDARRLNEKLRNEVEIFYSKGSVADAIANLNKRNDETKKTLQVLETITLENKTDIELIDLLKHREELMRGHALQLLFKKVTSNPTDRLLIELRNNVQALVRTLSTKEAESLMMTLDLYNAIMDDDFKVKFREAGGMRNLAKLLLMPELLTDVNFVIKLLQVIFQIVTIDDNKENFRSVNGIISLYPLLSHTHDNVVILTTDTLAILADLESNRIVISKSIGTVRQIFKNAKSDVYNKRLSSLRLLHNIMQCAPGRDSAGFEDLRSLITLLEPKKLYQFESSHNFKIP